ncbi:hypothetical protein O9H85_11265 [Paenibacillus filicis]|uniref:Uncharacterized protein n=1 Tax=Paenibacillus gyeongsangnamensis TaxID=3388067 RepID=A0ABT4Q7Z9_9BACL|nr:hypothetical protein [Paenibacillus filicis]MCZ8512989.1 hypothetical protein [Paenibacillus filicis]
MKLRLIPVVVSVLISGTVLFGGYFAYQSYAMESPLQKTVSSIPGVHLVSLNLNTTDAVMELKLDPGVSLREAYAKISKDGAGALGTRTLKLKVDNASSPKLDQWWSSALFEVAQAMETKQYSQIPKTLEARSAAAGDGLKVTTEMDDRYVYITMIDGDASKYVMLPRTPAKMGVWPNE